ncbi:hypothetical protein SDC9_193765 [bioreactor metagenome]|uniref:Uncharacterized protein n=1 Tax=bioreactor metagenome TaxID=1076179 RepID=A0A645I5W7_9ZZZZ
MCLTIERNKVKKTATKIADMVIITKRIKFTFVYLILNTL